MPEKQLKVLILGASGSGKTEIGHVLSKMKRRDFEATNGSKFYQVTAINNGDATVSLTEIGGNDDMQKLWHYYYAASMAIIYCFDLSSSYEKLCATFKLLQQILVHSFVRGKPILLIGTKSDLVSDGLQLYDIENAFHLEAMARKYSCILRMCFHGNYPEGHSGTGQSLIDGFNWLTKCLTDNYEAFKVRTGRDTNIKRWQEQTDKLIAEGKMRKWQYRRFPNCTKFVLSNKKFYKFGSQRQPPAIRRPHTAPAYTIFRSHSINSILSNDSPNTVPNNDLKDSIDIEICAQRKCVTDV